MRSITDRSRVWLGTILVAAGAAVLLAGYAQVRDESDISLQMPYVLTAGFFAFALTGLGLVSLRSHDDHAFVSRLGEMERTLAELRESNEYLTQMLEAALLPDEEFSAVQELALLQAVGRTVGSQVLAHDG
jgi:hypothetical protein